MGLIRGGVPTELAIALKDAYNLQGFIETGTIAILNDFLYLEQS